jgi:hypothetical protein
MDLLMICKESRVIYGLEEISKTKIRGVLSLVKNAHAVIETDGCEGESIHLFLGKDIVLFQQFREKQDAFINKCCMLQHIFIPLAIKGDLIWHSSPSSSGDHQNSLIRRIEELKRNEEPLEQFFLNEMMRKNNNSISPLNESSQHQQPSMSYHITNDQQQQSAARSRHSNSTGHPLDDKYLLSLNPRSGFQQEGLQHFNHISYQNQSPNQNHFPLNHQHMNPPLSSNDSSPSSYNLSNSNHHVVPSLSSYPNQNHNHSHNHNHNHTGLLYSPSSASSNPPHNFYSKVEEEWNQDMVEK